MRSGNQSERAEMADTDASFSVKRSFTLLEILVALAILVLLMATVLPRALRVPQRLVAESARSRIESALRETALQAIASGQTVEAVLDMETNRFLVRVKPRQQDALSRSKLSEQKQDNQNTQIVSTKKEHKLPDSIKWEETETTYDEAGLEQRPVFTFHPDGEAAGPKLFFTAGKRSFRLAVDVLTGHPNVEEREK